MTAELDRLLLMHDTQSMSIDEWTLCGEANKNMQLVTRIRLGLCDATRKSPSFQEKA